MFHICRWVIISSIRLFTNLFPKPATFQQLHFICLLSGEVAGDTCTLDKLNVPCRGRGACPIEGPVLSKVVEPPFGREVVKEVGPSTVFPVVHWDLQNPGEVLLVGIVLDV